MDELHDMIERRKDKVQDLEAEIRVLARVEEFARDVKEILPMLDVDVRIGLPGVIRIKIDFLALPDPILEAVEDSSIEIKKVTLPSVVNIPEQPEQLTHDPAPEETAAPKPAPKPAKPARKLKPKTGPWSDREIDELVALRLQGKTPTEIAQLISRDVKAVANKLYRIKDQIEAAEGEAQDPPEDAPSSEPKPEPTPPVSPEAASPASPAPGGDAGSSSPVSSSPAQPTGNGVRIRKRNGMALDFCKAAIADHLSWVYAVDKADNEQFWAPDLDLQLITILARGDGIPGAVSELGRIEGAPDRAGFVDRVQMLLPHATIDNQKFTLELLKERVAG